MTADSRQTGGERPLRGRAIRGSIWTVVGFGAGQFIRFAANLVLTRLLFPEAFGLMALVFLFMQGLALFSDIGSLTAIVQSTKGEDRTFLDTAWTIEILRGLLLWGLTWAIAWPVATLYGQPQLLWLLPAGGLLVVMDGFRAKSFEVAQRNMRLERLTIIEITTQAVASVSMILLAWMHRRTFGPHHPGAVWALLVGTLFGGVVRLLLSHFAMPGVRHRLSLHRESVKTLFGFSRWIIISTALTFLSGQSDRLIFGKMIPLTLFGVYNIANALAGLPIQVIQTVGRQVLFPAYSRTDDIRRTFWQARLPLVLGGGAIASVLAAAGPFLIRILYDQRYAEAAWILQYLAMSIWFQILEAPNSAVLFAQGRLRWSAGGNAVKLAGLVFLLPLGFWIGGFRGALVSLILTDVLKYLVSAVALALRDMPCLGRDSLYTAFLITISALGFVCGSRLELDFGSRLSGLFGSAGVVGVSWGAAGLRYFVRWRADHTRESANSI